MSSKDNDETLLAHATRVISNACTSCFGCIQTVDEQAKIKANEYHISSIKKNFGVQYIDLIERGASEDELKKCVDECRTAIAETVEENKKHRAEIERVKAKTNEKLIRKPGTEAVPPAANTAAAAAPSNSPPSNSHNDTHPPASKDPVARDYSQPPPSDDNVETSIDNNPPTKPTETKPVAKPEPTSTTPDVPSTTTLETTSSSPPGDGQH
jgi:hypothetical protein